MWYIGSYTGQGRPENWATWLMEEDESSYESIRD